MYKIQIAELKDKGELNRENGWRIDKIQGIIVKEKIFKYGQKVRIWRFERENGCRQPEGFKVQGFKVY